MLFSNFSNFAYHFGLKASNSDTVKLWALLVVFLVFGNEEYWLVCAR